MRVKVGQLRDMIQEVMDRDSAQTVKDSLDAALEQLRYAASACKGDPELKQAIKDAMAGVAAVKRGVKVPRAPKSKEEPYRGGGTWHPSGMGPTGRRLPGRSSESW